MQEHGRDSTEKWETPTFKVKNRWNKIQHVILRQEEEVSHAIEEEGGAVPNN